MYDDEALLIAFMSVVAFVVVFVIALFAAVDSEMWNTALNGCYIHEVHENSLLGNDSTTLTTFCPKEK